MSYSPSPNKYAILTSPEQLNAVIESGAQPLSSLNVKQAVWPNDIWNSRNDNIDRISFKIFSLKLK